jgi:hypothetical protein
MGLAKEQTAYPYWMDINGNTGRSIDTANSLVLQRARRGITKDFVSKYGSQDFLSQLKIRRDQVAANQKGGKKDQPMGQEPRPDRQPRPTGADTSMGSIPPLFYQPTPGVYEPFNVEDESFFSGGTPQDSTRRGGVKRNKSNRAGAVSKTRTSLSIGGGATAPGTAIGGRQLSL